MGWKAMVMGKSRPAPVVLLARDAEATLWMREGQLADARLDDGRSGTEALFEALGWTEGGFSVSFGPVSTPDRFEASTTGLLLQWSRLQDEASQAPPFAAIPDQPPLPPRDLMATHRALTLLNWDFDPEDELLSPLVTTERYFRDFPWEAERPDRD
jgi:hypothetical protein